jgi:hypothetical protein
MQGRWIWLARLLIGMVFFFNVQCSVAFLISPDNYAPAFELAGAPGESMVRGLGVLFLMWNVPYAVALWHPVRHFVSLTEAVGMQAIGVVGETLIWLRLPVIHALARSAVLRFMVFDASGLILLTVAWILVYVQRKRVVV